MVKHHSGSILTPGSEFRAIPTIANLLCHHEDWPLIKNLITCGVEYPLDTSSFSSESFRLSDLRDMLRRGNHKSASKLKNHRALVKAYKKEVKHG